MKEGEILTRDEGGAWCASLLEVQVPAVRDAYVADDVVAGGEQLSQEP